MHCHSTIFWPRESQCQILTNEFRDSVRRKSRKMEVCPDVLPDMADERAEEGIFHDLDHSLLRDAIETLPKEMKEAIMLHSRGRFATRRVEPPRPQGRL